MKARFDAVFVSGQHPHLCKGNFDFFGTFQLDGVVGDDVGFLRGNQCAGANVKRQGVGRQALAVNPHREPAQPAIPDAVFEYAVVDTVITRSNCNITRLSPVDDGADNPQPFVKGEVGLPIGEGGLSNVSAYGSK